MQVSSETPLTQMSVVIRKICFCSLIFPSLAASYNSFLLATFYLLFRKKMKLIYDEMRQDMYETNCILYLYYQLVCHTNTFLV